MKLGGGRSHKCIILHKLGNHWLYIFPVLSYRQSTEKSHFQSPVWVEVEFLASCSGVGSGSINAAVDIHSLFERKTSHM